MLQEATGSITDGCRDIKIFAGATSSTTEQLVVSYAQDPFRYVILSNGYGWGMHINWLRDSYSGGKEEENSFNFDLARMEKMASDDFISVPDGLDSLEDFTSWLREAIK